MCLTLAGLKALQRRATIARQTEDFTTLAEVVEELLIALVAEVESDEEVSETN